LNLEFDPANIENNIITDELHLFFQEIELALKILPEELWGIKDSLNIYRYVFNRYVTITQIKNEILSYINKHCIHARKFQYNLSVETINNNGKDLLYIALTVNDINDTEKTYLQKFLIG
jgi:hypothetical protein